MKAAGWRWEDGQGAGKGEAEGEGEGEGEARARGGGGVDRGAHLRHWQRLVHTVEAVARHLARVGRGEGWGGLGGWAVGVLRDTVV